MTVVKICGLKEQQHIQAAVNNGVHFIGFVFAPSMRRVSLAEATALAAHIPAHVKKVGVFVNETKERILEIAAHVPLDYIQYHGDESNTFIQDVGLPAIKAFAIRSEQDIAHAATYDVAYYLFDAPGTDFRGGSGHTFDWSLLEVARIPKSKVILAGGLNEHNVKQAITHIQPFAVDVSSGVELDGIKDERLITRFLTIAKEAQQ